uniref:Uncharacterized protein n=1 Tax=Vitrella brassicaformis TaxID=1169539 RepID=A0A7S1NYV4_9ALVE|mmetsp:Transcript_17326/g.41635  ORF Transcript_17326/g.41635 Transcript_17326/m.41635 type:complete len:105 (+) Transcript_17326:72-386(+)
MKTKEENNHVWMDVIMYSCKHKCHLISSEFPVRFPRADAAQSQQYTSCSHPPSHFHSHSLPAPVDGWMGVRKHSINRPAGRCVDISGRKGDRQRKRVFSSIHLL